MTEAPKRRRGRVTAAEVVSTQWVTPQVIRVTLGAPGFVNNDFTDRYVKLLFPKPGVDYPEPFDLAAIREGMPRAQWPTTRTYTVHSHDPGTGRLAIDFVCHGDEGLAAPWAAAAKPGDIIRFAGPGGAYAPDPDADWHLLVGDESALPAITAALAAVPPGAPAYAVIATTGGEPLDSPGELTLTSLGDVDQLLDAVRALEFPTGRVHAFVHGEAGVVKALRTHLTGERGLSTDQLSISGYWRRGKNEDGFQAEKAAEKAMAR